MSACDMPFTAFVGNAARWLLIDTATGLFCDISLAVVKPVNGLMCELTGLLNLFVLFVLLELFAPFELFVVLGAVEMVDVTGVFRLCELFKVTEIVESSVNVRGVANSGVQIWPASSASPDSFDSPVRMLVAHSLKCISAVKSVSVPISIMMNMKTGMNLIRFLDSAVFIDVSLSYCACFILNQVGPHL